MFLFAVETCEKLRHCRHWFGPGPVQPREHSGWQPAELGLSNSTDAVVGVICQVGLSMMARILIISSPSAVVEEVEVCGFSDIGTGDSSVP